jgi:8-oxo-dGTP pyrophosphatase MutT (NUDIX family)
VPRIDEIRSSLARYAPALAGRASDRHAAVALVLREDRTRGAEILFIERAEKEGDPWSGHMAFPGGRVALPHESPEQAAVRETLEEVGLSLSAGERLGRLDDLEGRHAGRSAGMVISGFVYHLPEPGALVMQASEVREAFWVPVRDLVEPGRQVRRSFRGTGTFEFPGIVVGEPDRHVVWGLTYRFLEVFFRALGRPFPSAWGAAAEAVAEVLEEHEARELER